MDEYKMKAHKAKRQVKIQRREKDTEDQLGTGQAALKC